MAKVLSGNISTNAYGNLYLQLSWTATQDVASNTSTINWELWSKGSYTGYYKAAPITVKIAGIAVYYQASRFELYSNKKLASNTVILTHDTNGAKSFSASIEAAIYSGAVNCTASDSWDLIDIPRAATITSAPNFTDEDNIIVKVNNPAGAETAMCISIDGNDITVPYKTFTGNEVRFLEAELEPLIAHTTTSNSRTVYFVLRTIINGNRYFKSVAKTFSVINAQPVIAPTVIDVGSGSTALTGNNVIMIKGFNGMRATINATAKKGATITSVKITNGGTTKTTSPAEFWYSEDNTFHFSATDSRGNTATHAIMLTHLVDYVRLTCNLTKNSVTTSGVYTVRVTGNCFAGSFGAVTNNVGIYYRWRESGATTWNWVLIPHTVSGTTYTATTTISGLDYKKSYEIQAAAIDSIGIDAYNSFGAITDVIAVASVPVFSWDKDDFKHNTDVYFDNHKRILGTTTDGAARVSFEPCNAQNVCVMGYGGYSAGTNASAVYGNELYLWHKNGLYINGATFDNSVKAAFGDYVTAQGTSGIWTYRKWNSGLIECWGTVTVNTTIDKAWGSLYVGASKMSRQNYPVTFTAKPKEYATAHTLDGACWIFAESGGTGANTTTQSGVYNVCRPTLLNSNQAIAIKLYVVGK